MLLPFLFKCLLLGNTCTCNLSVVLKIKLIAEVHCQYSTHYFNLWFCKVNLTGHLLKCLVLALRDCARIAVNKSFATDRHSITEQSAWTLGTVELLTTRCLQLSWCESYIIILCNACNSYRRKKQQFIIFCFWRVWRWLCAYCTWTSTNNNLYASSEKYFSLPSSHTFTVPHTSNYSN